MSTADAAAAAIAVVVKHIHTKAHVTDNKVYFIHMQRIGGSLRIYNDTQKPFYVFVPHTRFEQIDVSNATFGGMNQSVTLCLKSNSSTKTSRVKRENFSMAFCSCPCNKCQYQ